MAEHDDDESKPSKDKGSLSDRTKGIIVGAVSALAVTGLVYAIAKQETTAKPKVKPRKPAPVLVDDTWDYTQAMQAPPAPEEAEVEVSETETPEGGIKITSVLKDIGEVGSAAHGLAMLQPVAEALIALL